MMEPMLWVIAAAFGGLVLWALVGQATDNQALSRAAKRRDAEMKRQQDAWNRRP